MTESSELTQETAEEYTQIVSHVRKMEDETEQELQARRPDRPLPSEDREVYAILAVYAISVVVILLLAQFGLMPFAEICLPLVTMFLTLILLAVPLFQRRMSALLLSAVFGYIVIALAVMFMIFAGLMPFPEICLSAFIVLMIGGAWMVFRSIRRLQREVVVLENAYEFYRSVRVIMESCIDRGKVCDIMWMVKGGISSTDEQIKDILSRSRIGRSLGSSSIGRDSGNV